MTGRLINIGVKLWIFIGFFASLIGCATVDNMKLSDNSTFSTPLWTKEPAGPKKAIVVVLHGLNLKPEKMDDWAHVLLNHQAVVIRLSLYGHSGDEAHMAEVSADRWRDQFNQAMSEAQNLAEKYQVPIYFLGFSLGALVGIEWQAHHDPVFQKMVLIAPALTVPWYSRAAVNALSIFGQGFMLPSRSPKEYRAQKGTSIAAYQALFQLKDSLLKEHFKNANVKTLLIMDRYDELISSKNIRKIIWENRLSNWQLEIIDNRYAYDNYGFRHLMVDEEAMGPDLWTAVTSMMLNHLDL